MSSHLRLESLEKEQIIKRTEWLYADILYQSSDLRTMLETELSGHTPKTITTAYKFSLMIEGLPNCVAIE